MINPSPSPEHRWLHRLIGRWTSVSELVPGHEDHPVHRGEETCRALGDLWVQSEGDLGFGPVQMTLGFDPRVGRFVGTYLCADVAHLWVYDGALAPGEDRLVLSTAGPSFLEEGKVVPYRDELELVSPDERVLRGWLRGPDGAWSQFHQVRFFRA